MSDFLPIILLVGTPSAVVYLIWLYYNKLSATRPLYTTHMQEINDKYGTSFPTDSKEIDRRLVLGGSTSDLLFKSTNSKFYPRPRDMMFFEPTSRKVAVYRDKGIQVHDISWIKSAEYRCNTYSSGPGGIGSRTKGALTVGTSDVLSPMLSFSINSKDTGFEWVARIDAMLCM